MSVEATHAFEIIKQLGQGTFGTVFLCITAKGDKIVLKRIPIKDCPIAFANVRAEYKIFTTIRHPRIIDYFGFYQSHHHWNFLMEHAPNGTLADRIAQLREEKGRFSQKPLINVFVDVLAGVMYLHYRSVIHRDLKPDNILFDKDMRAKLVDFGIAKFYDSVNNQNMTAIGTPFYMAPEVANALPYDFKCDVWSLGIMLYEMCALEHPFGQEGTLQVFELGQPYQPPTINDKRGYSPDLQELCKAMLTREPDKRASLHQVVYHRLIRNRFSQIFFEK